MSLTNDDLALIVVLRSSLSTTIASYRLMLSDDQKVALHDPTKFELDLAEDQIDGNATILCLYMQSVTIAEKRSTDIEDTVIGRLRQDECRFNTLTILKNDLSISSLLYLDRRSDQPASIRASPTWRGKLLGTSSKFKDDFVVDDGLVVMENLVGTCEPVSSYVEQRRRRAERLFGQEWTLHHERTARKVESRTTQMQSVDDVLAQTQNVLDRYTEAAPMQTLFELTTGELTMNDMDRMSAEIAQLTTRALLPTSQPGDEMEETDRNTKIVLRPIETAPLPAMQLQPTADVGPMYDTIVSKWITPLHNKVPGRIRLAKEQLARRLAAELTLASHAFQIEDIEEQPESQQDAKPVLESQSWSLPMHLASSQLQNPYSSQLHSQSQSILPTPSPTGTPSVTTASSRTTSFASAEISNLTKFTTFTKPTPSALPRNLSKILSHWTPGANPAEYDWIATSRAITQRTREEEADSQLTEKQRARAHRKAERHIRRQRKEAQASQVQMLASSQMPELVVSASQSQPRNFVASSPARQGTMPPPPSTAFGGALNSSQHMGLGAASQAVPGRFGGRPPVKKKRKQGF